MENEQCMTRYQLLEDYAAIIDEQRAKLKAWEACADKLFSFAEIIRATEGNATRNPDYYNSACAAIEQYKKLKK
jgi:hypothetical protein